MRLPTLACVNMAYGIPTPVSCHDGKLVACMNMVLWHTYACMLPDGKVVTIAKSHSPLWPTRKFFGWEILEIVLTSSFTWKTFSSEYLQQKLFQNFRFHLKKAHLLYSDWGNLPRWCDVDFQKNSSSIVPWNLQHDPVSASIYNVKNKVKFHLRFCLVLHSFYCGPVTLYQH